MAYLDLLIQSCTIQRDAIGAADSYGNPAEDWQTHLTEDCRLQSLTGTRAGGREVRVGAEVVIADYKLYVNDIDVTEQDRIVLETVTYEILLVKPPQNGVGVHHKELLLRVVR